MGKEYRIFYPISSSFEVPLFFSLLKDLETKDRHLPTKNYNPEKRTDVYFIFPKCEGFGLKLRRTTDIELKIRKKVYPSGIEQWAKVISESASNLTKFESILVKKNPECFQYFKQQDPPIKIELKKERIQKSIQHFMVEQTELEISSGSKIEKWCSICIEGNIEDFIKDNISKVIEKIEKVFSENNHTKEWDFLKPMGYPEFLKLWAKYEK